MLRNRSISANTSLPTSDPNNLKQKLAQTKVIRKIGSGLTAKVYEVHHPIYGKTSLKIIETKFSKTKIGEKLVKNQIQILKQVQDHQNIIHMHQYSFKKDGEDIMILTNYCEGGDLEKKIRQAKYLSLSYSLQVFEGLVKAVEKLFSLKILHRDIKPANIFLKDNYRVAVLADFGFAIREDDKQMKDLNVGSPLYMAPESLEFKHFSQKSDIFGLGVVLFEMLTGKTPWNASSQRDLLNKMKKCPPQIPFICPSSDLKKLVLRCISSNQNQRPDLPQLKKQLYAVMDKYCPNLAKILQNSSTEQKNKQKLLTIEEEDLSKTVQEQQTKKQINNFFKPITIEPKSKSKDKDKTQNNKNYKQNLMKTSVSMMNRVQKSLSLNLNQNSDQIFRMSNKNINQKEKKLLNSEEKGCKVYNKNKSILSSRTFKKKYQQNKENIVHENGRQKYSNNGLKIIRDNQIANDSAKDSNFIEMLTLINPQVFTFLPNSLITKFKLILRKYEQILRGQKMQIPQKQQKNQKSNNQKYLSINKIHLNPCEQKDLQIQEINLCQSEEQLCKNIEGFIRRLYRLAKNYKGFKKEIGKLETLYQRVTIMGR